jgi:hypothetical protein
MAEWTADYRVKIRGGLFKGEEGREWWNFSDIYTVAVLGE